MPKDMGFPAFVVTKKETPPPSNENLPGPDYKPDTDYGEAHPVCTML